MVVQDLVEEDQPACAPSLLEGVQFQCLQDISDTSPWVVVGGDPLCSSSLDLLQPINVLHEVRVPCTQCWHTWGHSVPWRCRQAVWGCRDILSGCVWWILTSGSLGSRVCICGAPTTGCVTGSLQDTAPARWTSGRHRKTHRNALGGFFPCGQTWRGTYLAWRPCPNQLPSVPSSADLVCRMTWSSSELMAQ